MVKRLLQVLGGSLLGLLMAWAILRPGSSAVTAPGSEFLLPAPLPAPDFELTSHTGATVRLSELAAERTLVLFFGYTHCPDICPLTMAALGSALDQLGATAKRVLGVLVTVDPARDTPAQLASYLSRFPDGLMALTGPAESLAEAAQGYMVYAEPAPDAAHGAGTEHADYLVDHTTRVFVVHEGAVAMTFPPLTPAEDMAAGLTFLLEQ